MLYIYVCVFLNVIDICIIVIIIIIIIIKNILHYKEPSVIFFSLFILKVYDQGSIRSVFDKYSLGRLN